MKKSVKKKYKEFTEFMEKEKVTMILAITDEKTVSSTFHGTIMGAANLISNFRDNDEQFDDAVKLESILCKREPDPNDFMSFMMEKMEKKMEKDFGDILKKKDKS